MDTIYSKYEHISKCKSHNEAAKIVCMHSFCLGRFLCQRCQAVHSSDHTKNYLSVESFFSCSIKAELESKLQKSQSGEEKTKKEVMQVVNRIDNMFNDFETAFMSKLKELKDRIKGDASEALQDARLECKYWAHLKDKLGKSYTEFIEGGLLDEKLFYEYVVNFNKTSARITTVTQQPGQEIEESNRKVDSNIDYVAIEEFLNKSRDFINKFASEYGLKAMAVEPRKSIWKRSSSIMQMRRGTSNNNLVANTSASNMLEVIHERGGSFKEPRGSMLNNTVTLNNNSNQKIVLRNARSTVNYTESDTSSLAMLTFWMGNV
jgi:hypothetical protein